MKNVIILMVCNLIFIAGQAQSETSISPNKDTTGYSSKVEVSNTYSLSYSLEYYESMILRCQELTAKLKEHDKAIQEGTMKGKRLKQWKKDLTEAQLLNYKITDYTAMYKRKNFSLKDGVNKDLQSNYTNFSKVLDSAKQYVGF